MSFENKYRVHEVAKDLGKSTKEITQILSTYATTPKNHMQVLDDKELSLIFERVTQNNQVADMQASLGTPARKEKAESPRNNNDRPRDNRQGGRDRGDNRNRGDRNDNRQGGRDRNDNRNRGDRNDNRQGQQNQQAQQQAPKAELNKPTTRVPEKKLVDTRKGGTVNLDKYDEHLETLAPERANKMQSGKQKIQSRSSQRKGANYGNKRKQEEQEKMRRLQLEIAKKTPLTVKIPDEIGVGELASRMKKTGADVVKALMKMGVMASLSEIIDYDTAALVAMELGCKVEKEVIVTIEEKLIDTAEDKEEDLAPRAPVVVVMGHVDHGKTSLLDYIRNAHVASGEAGGITQHIGAYQVDVNGSPVTFLDTPGHEAFTAMRARGAKITDICIIIVAADDSVMPQTVEAINHASAAGVPIVFAINKIDKPHANPEKIKEELAAMNYLVEEWGGKYQSQDISAKKGIGVEELMEKVLLEAEMLELRANPNRKATGAIIESTLDKGRGYVANVLVQNGTLRVGDIVLAGNHYGKVKAMFNERDQRIKEAGPATPALILGLNGAPTAGDTFNVMDTEQEAREIANKRQQLQREQGLRTTKILTLEDIGRRRAIGNFQELNIIVKGDVDGSIEALSDSLIKLSTDEIQVNVLHKAVGEISESDVTLAAASDAIIIGFQVRPSLAARRAAEREGVEIRLYSVIYQAIEEVKDAMSGMLAPEMKEEITGTAEVLETFHISKVGTIAGAIVREGKIKRSNKVRLIRDGIVRYTGDLGSLKRFKDDVKEVTSGYDCGLSIAGYNDIKVGDLVEGFEEVAINRSL